MAPRVSKIEMCMFCGEVPCVCNKPAPKPKAVRATKPVVDVMLPGYEVTPETFTPPATKRGPFAMLSPTEQLASTMEHHAVAELKERTESEVHADALQVILDTHILRPDEQARISKMVTSTRNPALDTQVNAWKKAFRG